MRTRIGSGLSAFRRIMHLVTYLYLITPTRVVKLSEGSKNSHGTAMLVKLKKQGVFALIFTLKAKI